MDYNQFIARENRFSRKPPTEAQLQAERRNSRMENQHRFSEPKGRINLIKINKNKLPGDFFLKKEAQSRRTITNKFHIQQEPTEHYQLYKKAESERLHFSPERLHFSPEKTSFFGFFQEQSQQTLRPSGNSKIYNRKFQTREEPKRESFPVEASRKLTTAAKSGKKEMIELFPPTLDEHLNQIVISTLAKNMKASPRKEYTARLREHATLNDPEKQADRSEKQTRSGKQPRQEKQSRQSRQLKEDRRANAAALRDISMSEPVRENESMTMTFFNAKSTCFPPIGRSSNQ